MVRASSGLAVSWVVLIVLGGFCTAAEDAGVEVTVVGLEGGEVRHRLKGLLTDQLEFDDGVLPLKNVAALFFAAAPAAAQDGPAVYLRNGDVLCNTTVQSGDESKLTVKSETLGDLKLDYKHLNAVTFAGKEHPAADVLAAFLKAPPPKEDQLLTNKGDTVSGYLEKFSGKELNFNSGGQSRAFTFEQLAACKFAPLEEYRPRTELRGAIELRDGSRVTGKLLGLADGKLKCAALDGQAWEFPVAVLCSITFRGGKQVYLTELAPSVEDERPYVGGLPVVYPWRRNRAANGARMTIGSKTYEHGLGVSSYSRLEYQLAGQYAKFLCEVGLDTAGAGGACSWKILLDGKEAAAGTALPDGKAQVVSLDLQGVQQLALVCDYGSGENDAGGCLDWAGARLLKP